jgi:hypothetical protein
MKKQLAISSVAGIAIALLALLSLRSSTAEAATSGLMLDPETGLPAGSLVFHVEDHTCIVLPNHELECFCPCSSGTCNAQVEIVPLPPAPAVTGGAPVTPTGATTRDDPIAVPRWEQPPEPEPGQMPAPEPEPGGGPARDRPKGNNGVGNGVDPQPPGNPPINDGPGTGPGNPGNRGGGNGRSNKKD